jgi:hypothetical protein
LATNYEFSDWHLTPRGWLPSEQYLEMSGKFILSPPADRVLTCRIHEPIGTALRINRHVTKEWKSSDGELIMLLVEKFGEYPF